MALPNRTIAVNDGGGAKAKPYTPVATKTTAAKPYTPVATKTATPVVAKMTPTTGNSIPAPNKNAPVQKLVDTSKIKTDTTKPINPATTGLGNNGLGPMATAANGGGRERVANPSGPSNLANPADDAARRAAAAYQDEQNAILAATKGNPNAYGGPGGGNPSGDDTTKEKPTGDPNVDPSQWYPGGGNGSAPATPGVPAGPTDAELLAQALQDADLGLEFNPYQLPDLPDANPQRLEHVDTTDLRNMLQQIVDAQKQQSQNQIDYGVEQGVNELTRAMEDAAAQYQTQRDQATADEMRALDNQALYAEARGDRGGIGEAQYASIQAAAAQNRRAVNDAQVKLGTDTARQISDLRSQGEFEKADQLLTITQNYLSKLMSLEQWALEANMSVDEFNSQLQQWVDEYNLNAQKYLTDLDLSTAQMTGVFANGNRTLAAQNQLRESLADSGSALLSAGVLPSKEQLEAMGMTAAQAKAYIARMAVV